MNDVASTPADVAVEPVKLEGGRYALYQSPDGGLVVARATGTCQTCQECGCGEQQAPLIAPAMLVRMASSGKMMGKLRGLFGSGVIPDE